MGPLHTLVDEKISLDVSGLDPGQKITLRCQTDGSKWTSWASFRADDTGRISLGSTASIEGSYKGIDPMGLIWSMRSESPSGFRLLNERMDLLFSLEVEGEIVAQKEIHRWKMAPHVEKIFVKEQGIVASLYFPRSEKRLPIVIALGGSGGGLPDDRAQLLASHGFAVLSLAYFGIDPLPRTLKEIPLEYFERAMQWIKRQPSIDSNRLGIWGVSRGSELALILGSLFPESVHAIAAYVPSSAVYSSFESPDAPAWMYRGVPFLPSAPFPKTVFEVGEGASFDQPISMTPLFLEGMKDEQNSEKAKIPVEKIQCPVLLVSGQNDSMWPSDLFSKQIKERMVASCTHLSYPGAGHRISPFYFPTTSQIDFHPMAQLWFDFGGNPKDQATAQVDSWKKTLKFFALHLQKEAAQ